MSYARWFVHGAYKEGAGEAGRGRKKEERGRRGREREGGGERGRERQPSSFRQRCPPNNQEGAGTFITGPAR